jgi:hypothetical protein
MRTANRPRRKVSASLLRALRPLFHYSAGRRAWVLRGVGRWVGPVLVARPERVSVAERSTDAPFRPGIARSWMARNFDARARALMQPSRRQPRGGGS